MAESIWDSTILRRRTTLAESRIDHDLVMLDKRRGRYLATSGSGTRILELLEHPKAFGELLEKIAAEFAVDGIDFRSDVEQFVADLAAHDVIEIENR